jgi:signal transduction histidine kinase/ligand-binding sensor domain-containing protein
VSTAILARVDGQILIGGADGLAEYDGRRWRAVPMTADAERLEISGLFEDRRGNLWAGTPAGVWRRAAVASYFEPVPGSPALVQSFTEDQQGTVWATDSQALLRAITPPTPVDYDRSLQLPAGSRRLLTDEHGTIWVAALGTGLLWSDERRDGRLVLERFHESSRITGLIQALYEDRERNVWVGMSGGLVRLSRRVITTDLPLEGLTSEGVAGLAVGDDGAVWVATLHALNGFSGAKRFVHRLEHTMAVHADDHGDLWVMSPQGVGRVRDGVFSMLSSPLALRVLSMTMDRRGDLWLCSGVQGLSRWRPGAAPRSASSADVARRSCNFVYTDQRGQLWVGFATGGVARSADGETWQAYGGSEGLAPGRINSIFEDSLGAVWVATTAGLSRLKGDRFSTISAANGLPSDLERSAVEDDEGNFWLVAHSGAALIRFSRPEAERALADPAYQIEYILYHESDGFPPVLPFLGSNAVKAGDGTLWIGTGAGVARVNPRTLPASERGSVRARLDRVLADGRVFVPEAGLAFAPKTSTFQIDYAALSLSHGPKLRFRYMLEGFSDQWVYAGSRRQAFYTNLPPGAYSFRVAATVDGRWTHPESVWVFSLQPAFYQTVWFWALCASALLMAAAAYWWMSMRAVRARYALILAERARVSRDIHDTLLQSLGAVGLELEVVSSRLASSQDDAAAALRRLRRQVQHCVTDARQSIWELRSPTVKTGGLAHALREMAEREQAEHQVDIHVDAPDHPRVRSDRVQEQLLRITREALLNAIRHGRAGHVSIAVHSSGGSLSLSVSDDGCGFDPAAVSAQAGRYGISGMRERAQQLDGQFEITSRPGHGTTITVTVALA